MKVLKEWSISAPWGNIALKSWGNPNGEPILLVHGRQDSLATFTPLLDKLPDSYHYVAFDFPGHGKSDPFPIGIKIMRLHFVSAIDYVVNHLAWTQFVFLSHSMGGELGLFYNVVRPNRITKFIHLDIGMALRSIVKEINAADYQEFYGNYYDNYQRENVDDRVYTKRRALNAVMNARGLTEEQAEIVLSRNLIPVGEDQYRLSWDRRLKMAAPYFLSFDYTAELFKPTPPSLYIACSLTLQLTGVAFKALCNKDNFKYVVVEGSHDVHITNPERIDGIIVDFLGKRFFRKSKL